MVPLVLFLTSCHQEENNKSILKDTKVEQRTEDCIDENDELEFCLGAQFQPKTIVLNNVPGYPSSCTFKVKYEYKWCEVGTGQFAEIQVLLKNIDILEIDCAEYDQDVDDLYNNPCSSCPTIEDYIFGLEEKIQRLIEEDVFNFLQTSYNLNCNSSTSWTPVTIKFSQYSCHTYCFQVLLKTRSGGYWWKPRRIACDNFVCCIVETFMCFDPGYNKTISNVVKTKQGGPEPVQCVIPTSTYSYCNYYTSNCIDACEN